MTTISIPSQYGAPYLATSPSKFLGATGIRPQDRLPIVPKHWPRVRKRQAAIVRRAVPKHPPLIRKKSRQLKLWGDVSSRNWRPSCHVHVAHGNHVLRRTIRLLGPTPDELQCHL